MSEKKEIHLFIAVALIVLAAFLATHSRPSPIIKEIPSIQKVTGLAIQDISDCDPDDILFKATGTDNAHPCTPDIDDPTVPYAVCPFKGSGTGSPSDYLCSAACATNVSSPACNAILKLSTNPCGHAATKSETAYASTLCFQGVSCETVNFPKNCATLGAGYSCLAKLSGPTNAHIADCVNSTYSTQLCCKVTETSVLFDSDVDGVPDDGDSSGLSNDNPCLSGETTDCDDNCVSTPNGPTKGTCAGTTTSCTSDSDCGSSTCDLAQSDSDGDGAGDVCDTDPDDSCTIVTPNDNCPGFLSCATSSLSASWSSTSAQEGTSVQAKVQGGSDCNGLTFQFNVMNEDPTISTLDPQPATFTSGSASSTWTAEYHPEANENKYDFQATAIINGSAISVLSSNTLTVTANANSACGNGFTEGSNDEECDDGNTKNNDGCSSNCTLEGILGPQCSNECPVDGLGVCDGTTKIKLCGKYDADPCLDVSTAQNCASGTSCSSSYGDASCIPPVCSTAFECTIGECIDGFKERSCVNKGPSSCASYSPVTKIPCVKIESPAQLPVFDWFNVVMTLLLLAGYYVVKKKHF